MHETPRQTFFSPKKPTTENQKNCTNYLKNRKKVHTKRKLFYTVTHFSFWPRCQGMGKVEILGLEIWQNFKFSHQDTSFYNLLCLSAEVDEEDSCPPDLEAVE